MTHDSGRTVSAGERTGATNDPGRSARTGSATRPRLDRHVVEQARRRAPSALTAFFEHYFDRVYGLVYRMLGERCAAEDMSQEVFYRIHRAIDQVDPDRDVGAWVTTITYNTCRDYWRSRAHKLARLSVSVDDAPALERQLDSGDDPERALVARERERSVHAAIRGLPESLREVVVLHDYQGLAHDEIASMIGVSHAAARKRYSRALAELARSLEGLKA